MYHFLYLFIFNILFEIITSILPLWDFKNSSIDLLSNKLSINKTTYIKETNNKKFKLIKEFKKEGNIIKKQNYFQINNNTINEISDDITEKTNWEDINNFYYLNNRYFICPQGRYTMVEYKLNSSNLINLIENPFESSLEGWDLKCHYYSNYIYNVLLNFESRIFFEGYIITSINSFQLTFKEGKIFDFIELRNSQKDGMYGFFRLIEDDKIDRIYLTQFNIINGNLFTHQTNKIFLDYIKKYTYAYFNNDNRFFYFSCDTPSNFTSGYLQISLGKENINLEKLSIQKNNKSPFQFLEEVKIKTIKFIRNTKYVYYEITNKKESYYGIIDIEINKVIFNTNEKIEYFIPLTNHSMQAILNSSVYEICMIKKDGQCIEECNEDEKLIINPKGNYCGKEEKCNFYKLYPEEICIDYCNENIYTLDESKKKCGLCKDFYPKMPYKLLNNKGCLEFKPQNSYYINEELKIINYCSPFCKNCTDINHCELCEDNFYLENGRCTKKNCHKNCETCYEESKNDDEQYCIICKENVSFIDEEGNCYNKCLEGFFTKNEDKTCYKCHEKCKECFDIGTTKNHRCSVCFENSNYKFLMKGENLPHNCVDKCPDNTLLENTFCIETNDNINHNKINMKYIIIISISSLILIVIIIILIYKLGCKKKISDHLIEKIHNELDDNSTND